MRSVLACALLVGAFTLPAAAAGNPSSPTITLLFQFDGDRSEESIDAMKKELEVILRSAGLTFDYKLRSELSETDVLSELIVVTFKGHCRMAALRPLIEEHGPYAITHVSDGQILPFSEVACDRIRVAIRPAMTGSHFKHADMVLGRALGRVLAHEVYHILAKTTHHGSRGVGKPCLSGDELVRAHLEMDEVELDRVRAATRQVELDSVKTADGL